MRTLHQPNRWSGSRVLPDPPRKEVDKRRQNGDCMRCGSSQHFIRDCPFLPPRRPAGTVSRAQTLEVPGVDVPDALLDDDGTEGMPDDTYDQGKVLPQ
ncbi:hypothetical protein V1520DRAFT_349310 [Lipomyces starkeyi]